jgi:hypothetical protein
MNNMFITIKCKLGRGKLELFVNFILNSKVLTVNFEKNDLRLPRFPVQKDLASGHHTRCHSSSIFLQQRCNT